jgi:hypothetical protein
MYNNHAKFGPKGLVLNSGFEGGIKLSPLYDLEAMKRNEEKEKGKTNGSEEANEGKEAHVDGKQGERSPDLCDGES